MWTSRKQKQTETTGEKTKTSNKLKVYICFVEKIILGCVKTIMFQTILFCEYNFLQTRKLFLLILKHLTCQCLNTTSKAFCFA